MNNNDDVIRFLKSKDYKFIMNLNRGATGVTKLLKDETIGELFVCKKYSTQCSFWQEQFYNNFVIEIKNLYKSNHQNIVRVFNYYLYPDDFTGFILMEYVEGSNIREYIDANPKMINDVFLQVIEGFKYLEQKNILHRDIRYDNILVSSDGKVKIIDFGFSKQVDDISKCDKSISLNWMYSVPMEFEDNIYDKRTEVYFIGKLFEDLSSLYLSEFKYKDIIAQMIPINPINRMGSFNDVYRAILNRKSIEIQFDESEKEIYNDFAYSLNLICASIYYNASFIEDVSVILSKLNKLYELSILEDYIQNNNSLISCFIDGGFKYRIKQRFSTEYLKAFIEWWSSLNSRKQTIVLNNLWQRFDKVREEADLPF